MKDKHKAFCDHYIANGCNGTASYLAIYGTKISVPSANANAARLLATDKVKEYINKIREEYKAKTEITKESLLKDLAEIKAANKLESPYAAIKAIDMMVKMLGYNAPVQQEVTVKSEQPLFGPEENDA